MRYGDANLDFVVNLQDFSLPAANFGLSASGTTGTPQDWASAPVTTRRLSA